MVLQLHTLSYLRHLSKCSSGLLRLDQHMLTNKAIVVSISFMQLTCCIIMLNLEFMLCRLIVMKTWGDH